MNKNYDLILNNIINNLTSKKKLLLHSCCGPCSSYVINYLKDYFDITILYYNPNIEPKEEYLHRKNEQIKIIQKLDENIELLDCDYDNKNFFNLVSNFKQDKEGGIRCEKCYKLRLEKTCILAVKNKFDYFGTTLTVSPYKNASVINNIGENLANNYNINWLYSDFKKKDGYKKSIELSKKYNLYRQNYCGCLYMKAKYEKVSE